MSFSALCGERSRGASRDAAHDGAKLARLHRPDSDVGGAGRRPTQLPLALPSTWGGRREGAGRKRAPGRPVCVPHRARPRHRAEHPVHITLRASRKLRVLRRESVFLALRAAMVAAGRGAAGRDAGRAGSRGGRTAVGDRGVIHDRSGRAVSDDRGVGAPREPTPQAWRIVAFSVQIDHVHLIVEATDRTTLSRGLRGLTIRMARAVNRVLGRRGPVWSDRYHRRDLATPRETRNALVYVLMNHKKHLTGIEARVSFDPRSSAAWFDGWAHAPTARPPPARPPCEGGLCKDGPRKARPCEGRPCKDRLRKSRSSSDPRVDDSPVAPPRTWLLRIGWRRYGLIHPSERPRHR